ncbi:hypothetical protein [Pseudomonas indica]|uniref:hypothetical protein n=1 Tax=Pseudomonas indica TaxID=137658 RepID=UPI000BAB7AC2|nr:hypothetical protein [Pseudomonas indica]
MNTHGSSSRSGIVNEYVPLSHINDSRLDALIGRRNGEAIKVSTRIFETMQAAHDILLKTGHETFPDGPGNQEAAIWMSGGRSWTRMKMSRDLVGSASSEEEELKGVKQAGGGSCGEHRRMVGAEFQNITRHLPVFQVKESNEDHNYVIAGDWRDRTVGDKAVVVDAWQGLKKIYTYGERTNPTEPIRLITTPPGGPRPMTEELADALSTPPFDDAKMNRFTKMRLRVAAGPEAAQKLIQGLRSNESVWDQVTGTRNMYTTYKDPDGNKSAFNSVPSVYLNRYLQARDEMQYALPPRGDR